MQKINNKNEIQLIDGEIIKEYYENGELIMEFPEKIMKELEESDKQIERGQVYDAREVFKKFEDRYGY